jgi:hypothetical protein
MPLLSSHQVVPTHFQVLGLSRPLLPNCKLYKAPLSVIAAPLSGVTGHLSKTLWLPSQVIRHLFQNLLHSFRLYGGPSRSYSVSYRSNGNPSGVTTRRDAHFKSFGTTFKSYDTSFKFYFAEHLKLRYPFQVVRRPLRSYDTSFSSYSALRCPFQAFTDKG